MKKVMQMQAYCCGFTAGFLKGCAANGVYSSQDDPQDDADLLMYRPDWATEGEGAVLFLAGFQEGHKKRQSAFQANDVELIEAAGRIAGWTARRHPRNERWVYAERDASDGNITGEVWHHFVTGWRQTGGDRRRIKGV